MPSKCGAGEDSWKSLDNKEITPVNLKGDQPWIFTERTDAEIEAPVFWSSDVNRQEKSLILGKIEGWRRGRRQRMKWLDSVTDPMNMNLGKLWEILRDREAWRAAVHGVAKSWTRLGNWTITTTTQISGVTPLWCYCEGISWEQHWDESALSKAGNPPKREGRLIRPVGGLQRKQTEIPWGRGNSAFQQPSHNRLGVLPPGLHVDMGFASLHNHVSQFLKAICLSLSLFIHPSICPFIHPSYWFFFSGEPLIQLLKILAQWHTWGPNSAAGSQNILTPGYRMLWVKDL